MLSKVIAPEGLTYLGGNVSEKTCGCDTMKHETKLLTPVYVARVLGFQPRTVTRWCREGKFPTAKKIGRVWRIEYSDSQLHIMLNRKHSG